MTGAPLADGYHPLAPGKIAAVVTSLEMRRRPPERPTPTPAGWRVRRQADPTAAWYRPLHRRIGRDWLWFSRLAMSDAALDAILGDPRVQVHGLEVEGVDQGFIELDFRQPGQCEIAYLGVAREFQGRGAGRLLMRRALEAAWSQPIERLWVHTCTLDHPGALGFYQRAGFIPFERRVEVADDPRALGLLDADAAPHIPRL